MCAGIGMPLCSAQGVSVTSSVGYPPPPVMVTDRRLRIPGEAYLAGSGCFVLVLGIQYSDLLVPAVTSMQCTCTLAVVCGLPHMGRSASYHVPHSHV